MQARRSTKVLIVDDHPVVVSGCRAVFAADRSIQIISAADEQEALRTYRQAKPDVVIVDINLPGASGYEVLRRIRKDNPEAKIIMLSVNDDPAFIVRAVELGARGFVSKSDDPRHLVDAVNQVVQGGTYVSPPLAQSVT